MDFVIIGSGNVATVLGNKLRTAGHRIVQVFGRNEENAARLAGELGCSWTTRTGDLQKSEIVLFALSDDGLRKVAGELKLGGQLVLHTAGAVPMDVLAPVSNRYGVFYPLQSIRREIRPFPAIPLLIDAHTSEDLEMVREVASTVSQQVSQADDATRLKLHLSAIFVNNFSNFLYTMASEFCRHEQMDFELLLPLIRETSDRLARFEPGAVQTGPAIRGDVSTMERHLALLSDQPAMKSIYLYMSRLIWERYHTPENAFPL